MPVIIPTIAIAGAVAKGIGGAIQTHKANKALRELNKTAPPDYQETPELRNAYARAESMSGRGYSAEEKSAFSQDLARNNNAQRQSALDLSGGGMGGAINSVLQANNTGAINEFASRDAGLRRQNMAYADTLAQAVQTQNNMKQSNAIARRTMLEQAYGQASAQGKQNMYGAANDASNIAIAGMPGAKQASATKQTTNDIAFNPNDYNNDPQVDVYGNPID